jgi:hypothetical protein
MEGGFGWLIFSGVGSFMFIRAIHITEYHTAAGPYNCSFIREPSWNEIEFAIRRLDRNLFPFLWLYHEFEALEGELPDMDVVGGCGEYAIKVNQKDGSVLSAVDLTRSENRIDIWVSDQGASLPEYELCPNVEKTLEIVRLFCESGQLHSEVDWMGMPTRSRTQH